jgi:hypothetical protein
MINSKSVKTWIFILAHTRKNHPKLLGRRKRSKIIALQFLGKEILSVGKESFGVHTF